jgi:hypothetical protein
MARDSEQAHCSLAKDSNLTDNYIQRIAIKSRRSLSARSFEDYDGLFAFPRPLPWDLGGGQMRFRPRSLR